MLTLRRIDYIMKQAVIDVKHISKSYNTNDNES